MPSGTGEVVVVADGGRVAQLRPSPDLPNVLWRGDSALPLTGGNRLWLGPEWDVFYPAGPRTRDRWRCPPELDPGSWSLAGIDGGVRLSQVALNAEMTRRISPLEALPVGTDLPWAGFVADDAVSSDHRWSGWALTMTPAPSRIFVRDARDPVAIYGPEVSFENGWYAATGEGTEIKVGLPGPRDGKVVMASLGLADPGSLVVVTCVAPPDGTYLDEPPLLDGPPTALQVYDSPGLGFCELEHHFPYETQATVSTVFGVWGPASERLAIVNALA